MPPPNVGNTCGLSQRVSFIKIKNSEYYQISISVRKRGFMWKLVQCWFIEKGWSSGEVTIVRRDETAWCVLLFWDKYVICKYSPSCENRKLFGPLSQIWPGFFSFIYGISTYLHKDTYKQSAYWLVPMQSEIFNELIFTVCHFGLFLEMFN